jgi:hypothetical protein
MCVKVFKRLTSRASFIVIVVISVKEVDLAVLTIQVVNILHHWGMTPKLSKRDGSKLPSNGIFSNTQRPNDVGWSTILKAFIADANLVGT